MPISLSSTAIAALRLGSTEIPRAYLGATDVYPNQTSSDYTYSVPAGTFSEDLTDFATRINLAEAPASWWADVARTDGGDIRVFNGADTAIPFDIIEIDTTAQTGILVSKQTVTTAANTDFVLRANNDAGLAPLPVTDPNGRNAVYTAHEAVYMLNGAITDRSGNGNDLTWVGAGPTYVSGTAYGGSGGVDTSAAAGYGRVNIASLQGVDFEMFAIASLETTTSTNQTVMGVMPTVGNSTDRRLLGMQNSTNRWTYYSQDGSWENSTTDVTTGEAVSMSFSGRVGAGGQDDGFYYLNGQPEATIAIGQEGQDNLLIGSGRGGSDSDWRGIINIAILSITSVRSDAWHSAMHANWFLPNGLADVPLSDLPFLGVG